MLRDCLAKLPEKLVYFKPLLPSCALSLEALSLMGFGAVERGSPMQKADATRGPSVPLGTLQSSLTCCPAISEFSSKFAWKNNEKRESML